MFEKKNMLIIFYFQRTSLFQKKSNLDYMQWTDRERLVLIIIKVVLYSCTPGFKEVCFIQIFSRFWNRIKRSIERGSRVGISRFFHVQFIFHTMLNQASASEYGNPEKH